MSLNGMPPSSPFFPPNFLLPIQNTHHHQDPLFIGGPSAAVLGKRAHEPDAADSDDEDDYSQSTCGERKRRLSAEQVRALERSFETGNKLEAERKTQLARALGLKPRQVAIWFQNRRARWKNKQLEKDYGVLKSQLEDAKSQNQALLAHNKKLQSEISSLKGKDTSELNINLNKENEGSYSNRSSDNTSEINLDISTAPTTDIKSPVNSHQGIPFFPTMVQLLQGPVIVTSCPKVKRNDVPDEHFGNLLCNIDDQSAFFGHGQIPIVFIKSCDYLDCAFQNFIYELTS